MATSSEAVAVTGSVQAGFDARGWLERWEDQQSGHVPDREATFGLMLDLVERVAGTPARVLDLGCGPGSLSARAARRWPGAEIVAVDADPVMLELGRRTLGERVRWVCTDLGDEGWVDLVGVQDVDAVVSATALHWLPGDRLDGFARALARVLRPGGLFLDFDTLLADDEATPRLAAATAELRRERTEERTGAPGFEDFYTWWAAAEAEPALAPRFAERVPGPHRGGHGGSSLPRWQGALGAAGFAEVTTMTQLLDRRLLAALR